MCRSPAAPWPCSRSYIQRIPALSREDVAAIQQQSAATDPHVPALSPDDVVDERIVRALEAEDLFAGLYGER